MLKYNLYARHVIGVIMVFVFIMLEGGWNFNKEDRDKYPVDWSNGNCFDSFIYAGILYFIFLLSSKMRISWNIAFFSLLFILYITQNTWWFRKKRLFGEEIFLKAYCSYKNYCHANHNILNIIYINNIM